MAKKLKDKKLSKDAILCEAKRLFSIKGYKSTTLEDLTSSFGVSRPSIYYYYKSKMEILIELHSKGFKETLDNIDRMLSGDLPTKEKFRKLLEAHTRKLANDTELTKMFYHEEREMPVKVQKEIEKLRREYMGRIIELYKTGVSEGAFKNINPRMAVYIMFGACDWIAMWYSSNKEIKPDTLVSDLMEILTDGYEVKK
jgi:TetR/AcrR family transcriptional regulator, cholesterol catabolism regulator